LTRKFGVVYILYIASQSKTNPARDTKAGKPNRMQGAVLGTSAVAGWGDESDEGVRGVDGNVPRDGSSVDGAPGVNGR